MIFSAYPEIYVEDVLDFVSYVLRYRSQIVMQSVNQWPDQVLTIFCRSNYFHKQYLVSKVRI